MYNSGYGPTSPSLTTGINNPFSNDPSNPRNRFPDISNPTADDGSQYTSWLNNGINSNSTGYPQQQQQQQIPQFQQAPQTFTPGYGQQQQTGYPSSPSGFQPTSSFGQQLTGAAHISGSSYGYLSGQQVPQQQQQQQFNPVQQQLQSPGYVAQFDPYGPLSQWDGQSQNQNQNQMSQPQQFQSQQQPQSAGGGVSATNSSHPREYIRTHKAEIESWDNYAWKQLMNCFDGLKEAWDARKSELSGKVSQLQMQMQYGGSYYQPQIQQEGVRLQGLIKEAELHVDSIAASIFQIQEVFSGYRQSGDLASKRRVREATNAALKSLPDWPSPNY